MRKISNGAVFVVVLIAGCSIFTTGCNTLLKPVQVPATVTNYVAVPVMNPAGQTVTNLVPVVERVTNTVYVPNPGIVSGISTARGVAGIVPPPYGNLVDVLLVGATAVLGWVARRKTVAAASSEAQLGAVIDGVEKADTAGVVKAAISKEAANAGVSSELHKSVRDRT